MCFARRLAVIPRARSLGGGEGKGAWENRREEKCDTEGPVALSDARDSIKRVKSDVTARAFKSKKFGKLRCDDARLAECKPSRHSAIYFVDQVEIKSICT